jgi:hypothetical protein
VAVLKGSGGTRAKARAVFRKVLVVTQFSLTIVLIIGTIIIYNQIQFMRNKKLGFDQDHLVVLTLTGSLMDNCEAFKQEILRNPGVVEASLALRRQFHINPSDLWRSAFFIIMWMRIISKASVWKWRQDVFFLENFQTTKIALC